MTNWLKRINRMIREGDLVLDKVEDGKKIYKRPDPDAWKKDFLIEGVLASSLLAHKVNRVLNTWHEEGNSTLIHPSD